MRLALCRPDRVGDVILATACLEPIRQQFPEARLTFLARENLRPLLDGHPLLGGGGFLALPATRRWSDARALADALRERRLDALVHLHPDGLAQLAGRLARVPRRLGYRAGFRLDWTLTGRFPDSRRFGRKHEAQSNFDLLAPLGIRPPASANALRPRIVLPDRWRDSLAEKISNSKSEISKLQFPISTSESQISNLKSQISTSPYLVLNPTAFSMDLRWPPAHFVQLALGLRAARPELTLVLVADRADDPSVQEIRRALGLAPWLLDLAGRTNLAELGWLLRGARAQVSRDTGTGHLAAAVGCPVVQIFGRPEPIYGPGRWRVLAEPGRSVVIEPPPVPRQRGEAKRAFWRRRLTAIPPEQVLAATLALLG